MKISNPLLAAGTFALSASMSIAAPVEYHCDYKVHGRGGFLSKNAIYVVDEAAGTAKALDRVVSHFHKNPIDAALSRPSQKRIQLDWEIEGFPVSNSFKENFEIDVTYKVSINTSTYASKVRARFDRDARNNLAATGTCKIKK
ncbi:MAG: hypothetical protein GY883_14595 [Shimia sp.]|nr:hypothetical protein [Shimia sp.]